MTEKRVEWVDVCKGLAILAIFVGHIPPNDTVTSFVFHYHVPLFFLLSGFFYEKRGKLSFKNYFIKCVYGTLIPYAFFCALNIVFYSIATGNPASLLRTYLKQSFFGIRNQFAFSGQLWFLTCLFSIQILYYLLNYFLKNKRLLLIITFGMAVISSLLLKMPSMFFNVDSALYYIFFYSLGDVIYPKIKNFSFSRSNIILKCLITFLSFIMIGVTFFIYIKNNNLNLLIGSLPNKFIRVIFNLVITISIIVTNIIISFALKKSIFLAELGKNTIILFGFESISFISVSEILKFFGVKTNTQPFLFKMTFLVLKVQFIRILFFKLFNDNLYWAIGKSKKSSHLIDAE